MLDGRTEKSAHSKEYSARACFYLGKSCNADINVFFHLPKLHGNLFFKQKDFISLFLWCVYVK